MRVAKINLYLALLSLLAFNVQANKYSPEPHAYKEISRKYGLPNKILYALALQESQVKTNKRKSTPWPWVVKAPTDKIGKYFRTKQGAIDYAGELVRDGVTKFDVGIAQVNYYWHGKSFSSISEQLDPMKNLDYAASLVKGFYNKTGDWWVSVGKYHAPSEKEPHKTRATAYSMRVYNIYKDL